MNSSVATLNGRCRLFPEDVILSKYPYIQIRTATIVGGINVKAILALNEYTRILLIIVLYETRTKTDAIKILM